MIVFIYIILAVISLNFLAKGLYVLIWLPAGYTIYIMIGGKRREIIAILITAMATCTILGMPQWMILFAILEGAHGLFGRLLFLRTKQRNPVFVALLPSVLSGLLYTFILAGIQPMSYSASASVWFAVSTAYFLGSVLILPLLLYAFNEQSDVREILRLEMRWTVFVIYMVLLVASVYWSKMVMLAVLVGILLVPYINKALSLVIVILFAIARATEAVLMMESSTNIWGVYGQLLIEVIAMFSIVRLVVQLLEKHDNALNQLEDVIDERTQKMHLYQNQMDQLATHDQLTGVLNRRAFIDRGEFEVRRMKRYNRPLTLMHIDIDGLKIINDQYGYNEGDRLIVTIASLCEKNLRTSDIIARIAGDEFGILMPETSETDAVVVAEKILRASQLIKSEKI